MKHIAAYLLLTLGGKESPSAADIKALLETVGVEADAERLDKLVSELQGKDINELILAGQEKLASVPAGGAAAATSAGSAAVVGGTAEEKKEEKEEKEESDDDMGFGLFD